MAIRKGSRVTVNGKPGVVTKTVRKGDAEITVEIQNEDGTFEAPQLFPRGDVMKAESKKRKKTKAPEAQRGMMSEHDIGLLSEVDLGKALKGVKARLRLAGAAEKKCFKPR